MSIYVVQTAGHGLSVGDLLFGGEYFESRGNGAQFRFKVYDELNNDKGFVHLPRVWVSHVANNIRLSTHQPDRDSKIERAFIRQLRGAVAQNDAISAILDRDDAITAIQALWRGRQVRKNFTVKTVAPGVIHIKIQGSSRSFHKVGMDFKDRSDKGDRFLHRKVDILSIDPKKYTGKAVGGDKLFNPISQSTSDADRKSVLGNNKYNVFINAGFFNASGKYKGHEKHFPVGPTQTATMHNFIQVPDAYREHYVSLLGHGNYLSTAPLLGVHENKVLRKNFSADLLEDPKFQYDTVRISKIDRPGDLYHASDPNPRSGISIPSFNDDRVRVATATTNQIRGEDNSGFTMPEWANIMNRLSTMNSSTTYAVNLDGGGSVMMGIANENGEILAIIAENQLGRDLSTLLVYYNSYDFL